MKTLGPEMTTLFAFLEIAFGPTKRVSMRNDEKLRKILLYTHAPDEQKHYNGVVDY